MKTLQKFSSVQAPGPQPFQSGAPSRHPADLQTETLGRIGGVARPCGLDRHLKEGVCRTSRRTAVTLTTPTRLMDGVQRRAVEGHAERDNLVTANALGEAERFHEKPELHGDHHESPVDSDGQSVDVVRHPPFDDALCEF